MNQFKRAQVIMLPTITKSNLVLTSTPILSLIPYESIYDLSEIKSQHLYIISDDKIKEDNWFYNPFINEIQINCNSDNCKKIIATTDTSLKVFIDGNGNKSSHELTKSGYVEFLPQPSQQFIEKYIESYNKGEVITNVLVEYEDVGEEDWDEKSDEPIWKENWKLRINPKDNTITIKKLKDSWNREEVLNLLKKLNIENQYSPEEFIEFSLDEWVKENL